MIGTLVDLLGNFYVSNDFGNVEAIARSIHAAVPGDQVSLQFIGLVYYRTGRISEAVRIFDKVMHKRKPPAEAEPKQTKADPAPADSVAAVCYQQATRRSPYLAQAWYDLGTALLELRKFELAIPAFRNSLKAQPELTQAMLAIGRTGLRADDLAAAHDGFTRLRAQQPDNDEAYRGLGQVYRKRRDFAAARACFAWVRKLRRPRHRSGESS
jgi:tetratricopeptide (TPR) repeat protein